jgi:hypothetical protein
MMGSMLLAMMRTKRLKVGMRRGRRERGYYISRPSQREDTCWIRQKSRLLAYLLILNLEKSIGGGLSGLALDLLQ